MGMYEAGYSTQRIDYLTVAELDIGRAGFFKFSDYLCRVLKLQKMELACREIHGKSLLIRPVWVNLMC
jgi:hypothetical protein